MLKKMKGKKRKREAWGAIQGVIRQFQKPKKHKRIEEGTNVPGTEYCNIMP